MAKATPRRRTVKRSAKEVVVATSKRTRRRTVKTDSGSDVQPVLKPSVEAMREVLALRAKLTLKRPRFRRQESWRYRRLHAAWRKPKGIDNKMRLEVKGWPAKVKVGYRGPRLTRGLHPSGRKEVLIHNVGQLEKLSPERDAARLSGSLGQRKKIGIMSRAKELGIRVLNPSRLRPFEGKASSR